MPAPFDLTLDDLRRRTSEKWRRYPADVLPLWVAEMDVHQAQPVIEAVTRAITDGDTGYASTGPYATAWAAFARRRFGWAVDPEGLVAVPDVMRGVAELIRVVTDPDDVVVISPPVYPPFALTARTLGRRLAYAPLTAEGRLDPEALDGAFGSARVGGRRAAYLLCNPQNPTGTLPTADELATLGDLARRHGVQVIADEIHAPIVLRGAFVPATTVIPEAVALHSASKAFNLAGLPAAIVVPGEAARGVVVQLPPTVTGHAAHLGCVAQTAALEHGDAWLDEVLVGLRDRVDQLGLLLDERLPAVRWHKPEATYLTWLDLRGLPGLEIDDDPARALLARAKVAVNPGPTFGAPGVGFVRLNAGTIPAVLDEAVARIAIALG